METEITAALIGIASALITAFITKSTADKKNAIENITQERKNWRDDLRGATIALRRYFENKGGGSTDGKENCGIVFHSAAEAKAFFEVRLNLGDSEDCKLMAILDRLVTHDCSSRKPTFQKWEAESKENGLETEKMLVVDLLAHFEEGMSHNLKYDWERAKKEVNGNGLFKWIVIIATLLAISCCYAQNDSLNNDSAIHSQIKTTSIEQSTTPSNSESVKCGKNQIQKCYCLSPKSTSKDKIKFSRKDSIVFNNNINVSCVNSDDSRKEKTDIKEVVALVTYIDNALNKNLKGEIWKFIQKVCYMILKFLILFGVFRALLNALLKLIHKLSGFSPMQNKFRTCIAHIFSFPCRIKLKNNEKSVKDESP